MARSVIRPQVYLLQEYFENSAFHTPTSFENFRTGLHSKIMSLVKENISTAFGMSLKSSANPSDYNILEQVALELETEHLWSECEACHLDMVHLEPNSYKTWYDILTFIFQLKAFPIQVLAETP